MPYVIIRVPDGAYVAQPGAAHSYTTKLEQARIYLTREFADRDRCIGNEIIRSVMDCFGTATHPGRHTQKR